MAVSVPSAPRCTFPIRILVSLKHYPTKNILILWMYATLGNLFQAQDGKRNKVTLTPCTDVTLCWANWMRETVAASNTSNLHPQQPLPTKAGPSADRNLSAWYPDNILGGQRDQASAVSNFWKWIRIFLVFSYSESSDELFATIFFPPGPPPCSIENNFPCFFFAWQCGKFRRLRPQMLDHNLFFVWSMNMDTGLFQW